ncbi:MAG: 1-acyl-sn-glycerol-3-phosphate acyltransferase, partial [Muribaculaceae bacterium]|nr:1-acyl-sn-glycerol-3-phosphate acyltransferase [Muribaculaceae bacterium]
KGGASLVVFPEGARTWDGHMRQFKKGAFQLAMEFNLPLVPVSIDGAFDVMPRTARLPRPGHITLTIHKPIPPVATAEERNEAMRLTADTIREALPERFR